ncbi:MAG: hypothetical protein HC799_16240, partial [Limnothrix sp. RL_2_0]|nr:hypothetical protein [Limnothrix sp. RL_2_0]
MSDQQRCVIVPAHWYAFIPADSAHAAQWVDLYDVSVFDWYPDPVNPTVHITFRSGFTQKYRYQRAAHLIEQWSIFQAQ